MLLKTARMNCATEIIITVGNILAVNLVVYIQFVIYVQDTAFTTNAQWQTVIQAKALTAIIA